MELKEFVPKTDPHEKRKKTLAQTHVIFYDFHNFRNTYDTILFLLLSDRRVL